jgi:nitrogen fixation/metabolism regulation signal transduction histidine kinase
MSPSKPALFRERKGRNCIIRPAFQWKYSVIAVVLVFLVSLIVSAEGYGILYQQVRSAALYQPGVSHGDIVLTLVLSAAALAVFPALVLGLWSIVTTHRICGPLYVLERYFGELIDGRFPRRRPLRKRDEFKDFYELFWRVIQQLEMSKRADFEATLAMRELAAATVGADDETRRQALETIHEQCQLRCEQYADVLGIDLDEVGPPTSTTRFQEGETQAYARMP